MWLDEHTSKELLAREGVRIPDGNIASTVEEAEQIARNLGFPVYVKALVGEKDRLARGGIQRVERFSDVRKGFEGVTANLATTRVRVEREHPSSAEEWYLATGYVPPSATRSLLFSPSGGTGIEKRLHTLRQVPIDPLIGLRGFHVTRLTSGYPVSAEQQDALQELVCACDRIVTDNEAVLLELNPVAVSAAEFVVLDARIILDEHAARPYTLPSDFRSRPITGETTAQELKRLGIDFVDLGGSIGVVSLGAGITMHLLDCIERAGGRPGFFLDATAAAVADWRAMFEGRIAEGFVASLAFALQRVRSDIDVLLVNFLSGGTPIDALMVGFLRAMDLSGWGGAVVVHMAGRQAATAAEIALRAGLPPAQSIDSAVQDAVRLAGG